MLKKKTTKKQKQKTQLGDFFFIFSICQFLSVLKMFTIHVLRSYEKNGMDISKSGREYGSQSLLRFCVTRFSDLFIYLFIYLFIFQTST